MCSGVGSNCGLGGPKYIGTMNLTYNNHDKDRHTHKRKIYDCIKMQYNTYIHVHVYGYVARLLGGPGPPCCIIGVATGPPPPPVPTPLLCHMMCVCVVLRLQSLKCHVREC